MEIDETQIPLADRAAVRLYGEIPDHVNKDGIRVWTDDYGVTIYNVHPASGCRGRHCAIHRPSAHPMSTFPRLWRADKHMIERICPHGVGHPDPDDMLYHYEVGDDWKGDHACDGCCNGRPF